MADAADPNKAYADTRTSVRDTAKWIVSILGATIVLVIGGGLIARVPDLEWLPRIISAVSLLGLAAACLYPLKAAIDIVASRTIPFADIAVSDEFAATRAHVDQWLNGHYPPGINTVKRLYDEYVANTAITNDDQRSQNDRDEASAVLGELQPRIREVIELCSTERLQMKFEALKAGINFPLVVIAVALLAFLLFSHKEDATEKALAKPTILVLPRSDDVEMALNKAGLDPACYKTKLPQLVQIAERAGLKAVVIAVPDPAIGSCRPVRVIVTDDKRMYAD
jgi:hypothetical protein